MGVDDPASGGAQLDEEAKRKVQAKRLNEHVKLGVTTLNAIALVVFGAGVLQPILAGGGGLGSLGSQFGLDRAQRCTTFARTGSDPPYQGSSK